MTAPLPRPQRIVTAEFYQTAAGNEPVRAWLKTLSLADRQAIGIAVRKVEYGWPIGMPTCDALGGGPWEIRVNLENRIARIMFCAVGPRAVLLHGFIKKSQTAPKNELDTTRMRQADLLARLPARLGAAVAARHA
jgi:phage-related protein